ncbi:acyltransferase family protein [Cryptosporangium arvum]|uniref:acyltransferase family protein n=1 Tax=Cryptosporangium arvum TaxID=80871 RepID=UPI0004B38E7F|nr:acyltransferase family protein [Cryptosporangium arvum]
MTPAVGTTVPGARRRELYLDALRTAAIVRVVTYHTFGGAWLSWAFPAMGVMFALAGGLMVNSLDRQDPTTVIRNRIRRLLPALWLFGAITVPLMVWAGGRMSSWTNVDTGEPIPLWHLVFWFVPLLDPPGNEWGENVTVVLWYLRTYLWLVLLSPVLLTAFRRAPIPTIIAPLGLLVAQAWGYIPNGDDGPIWALVSDLGIFAPCWMLGFAHRTGALKRLPNFGLVAFVLVAAGGAVGWVLTHPSDSYDLNGIPIAQSLWSIAVILPLLRFAPDASWIGRTPVLGRFVALVNNRAVTIYLWHNILIDLAFFSGERLEGVGGFWESGVSTNPVFAYAVVWVLIAVAVMLFGWAEDLAARRKPRLWPVGPSASEVREKDLAREAAADTPGDGTSAGSEPYVPTFNDPMPGVAPGAAGPGAAGPGAAGPGPGPGAAGPDPRYAPVYAAQRSGGHDTGASRYVSPPPYGASPPLQGAGSRGPGHPDAGFRGEGFPGAGPRDAGAGFPGAGPRGAETYGGPAPGAGPWGGNVRGDGPRGGGPRGPYPPVSRVPAGHGSGAPRGAQRGPGPGPGSGPGRGPGPGPGPEVRRGPGGQRPGQYGPPPDAVTPHFGGYAPPPGEPYPGEDPDAERGRHRSG